jgi:predicted DNA-binding transcriptional regulator AlpA
VKPFHPAKKKEPFLAFHVHSVDGAGARLTPSLQSVPEFCADNGISRSLFYRLVKEGGGPRLTKVSRRTLISSEAAAEWRTRMERETEQAAVGPKPAEYHRRPMGRRAGSDLREAA